MSGTKDTILLSPSEEVMQKLQTFLRDGDGNGFTSFFLSTFPPGDPHVTFEFFLSLLPFAKESGKIGLIEDIELMALHTKIEGQHRTGFIGGVYSLDNVFVIVEPGKGRNGMPLVTHYRKRQFCSLEDFLFNREECEKRLGQKLVPKEIYKVGPGGNLSLLK
jgi:hypothetical protein